MKVRVAIGSHANVERDTSCQLTIPYYVMLRRISIDCDSNRPIRLGSAGLDAPLLEGRRGCRRGEELDQCLCRVNLLRPNLDAAGENRHLLDVRRQRADIVDAGGGYQLAHLLKADLGFAAGDEARDEHTAWGLLELRPDLVGDAHALEHADDIVAARSGG